MNDPIWTESGQTVLDLRLVAVIETDDKEGLKEFISPRPAGPLESVAVKRYEPQRVQLLASLDRPGLVILADTFYPGWRLTIDGRTAPIYRANRTTCARPPCRPGSTPSCIPTILILSGSVRSSPWRARSYFSFSPGRPLRGDRGCDRPRHRTRSVPSRRASALRGARPSGPTRARTRASGRSRTSNSCRWSASAPGIGRRPGRSRGRPTGLRPDRVPRRLQSQPVTAARRVAEHAPPGTSR